MKIKIQNTCGALALLVLLTLSLHPVSAPAQGTAFVYQGDLNDGGAPANGSYDLTFTLYDATNLPGNLIAGPLTNSATAVSNGLFSVTLDFGAGVFNGSNYWLEIGVRTNGGAGFATLMPRQPLLPVPYAIYSPNAGSALEAATAASAASVSATNISGSLSAAQLPTEVLTNNESNPVTFNSIVATNLMTQTGQNLSLTAANGIGDGGDLRIAAGNAGVTSGGSGGNLTLQAGGAMPQGGSGYFNQGAAGAVSIAAGGGYNGVGGNVTLTSGGNSPWSQTSDGYSEVTLQGGTLNSGDGARIDVEGGHNISSSGSSSSRGGNVNIASGNGVGGYAGGNIVLLPGTGTPNGNVGIGTASPATALQVAGTVTATSFTGSGAGLKNVPASAITGGITTNIVLSGYTFYITNGIIMNIQ